MYVVKMKGKTVEDAITGALEVLKVSRDSVDIKVLSEGESGVLGVFGGRDAEVEVSVKLEPQEQAKVLLQEILDKAGYVVNVYVAEKKDDTLMLEVKGDDIPRIIGKDGKNIDALQTLIGSMVNKGKTERVRIVLDAGGYRKKQEKRIENIAKEAADEVMISNKDIELPPMTARERRIVHMVIKEYGNLATKSLGEGENRRVVLSKG